MTSTSSFEIYIPENLTFNDYLAICQTARIWADGYDLKSFDRLISTLAPIVLIDYSGVNPAWGIKKYSAQEFASLWMSADHLGNRVLATQHLLGTPYFAYAGPRKETSESKQVYQRAVEEVHVSWQILASHARRSSTVPMDPVEPETSDHRSFIEHHFVKIPTEDVNVEKASGAGNRLEINSTKRWKLAVIRPSLVYAAGDFGRVRRPEGEP